MAEIQSLEYVVTNNNVANKPTNLFVSNVNKETGAMDTYQLPLGPRGPRTLIMTSSKSSDWKPVLTDEGKKLDSSYQKFLLTDVAKESDNQRAAYLNKNFTKVQREELFKGVPKVNNLAAPTESQNETQESGATSDQVKDASGKFDQGKLGGQAIKDGGYRDKYTGGARGGNYYIYPIDMSAQQDRIKFTMFRYEPKNVSVSNISSSTQSIFSGSNTKGSARGTVYLPVQPTISDSNAVTWGEDTLNSLDAIAATAAYGAIQGGGEELGDAASGVADLISGSNNDIKAAISAAAAGAAVNKSFLTRTTGGIINPNLELLFQGPSLRSFSFTFSMSAREKKEAEEIRRIIRFFKQGMSVKRSQSFLFLKTPNVFDIQYEFGAGKEHPYLNKIKTCALQTCTVNYTPAGNYATFEDGAMTQYDMTLTFGEIDPIYDDNYGTEDSTPNIGY